MTEVVDHLVVGKADIEPSKPSHITGVRPGNRPVRFRRTPLARRSTGINPGHEEPIDPRMPHLSPA